MSGSLNILLYLLLVNIESDGLHETSKELCSTYSLDRAEMAGDTTFDWTGQSSYSEAYGENDKRMKNKINIALVESFISRILLLRGKNLIKNLIWKRF